MYFVTFCSQGDPYDAGKNLTQNSDNIKNILSSFFDEVFVFTPQSLKLCKGSEDFCNQVGEEFPLNPGISFMGCGDFKSFIIDKLLSEIEDNAILFYNDCNFSKYPQYWQTDWENLREMFEFLMDENFSDFYIPFESPLDGNLNLVRYHGKRYTTDFIIGNNEESELVSRCYEIASSRMIIRNTERSREFFSEYKNLCRNKELLSKYPNPNPYPEFTHSCPEQHVLNCLIYKHILDGKLHSGFPKFMLKNRVLRINDNLTILKNDELTKYMDKKSIKNVVENIQNKNNGNDFRGYQEFREDLFIT